MMEGNVPKMKSSPEDDVCCKKCTNSICSCQSDLVLRTMESPSCNLVRIADYSTNTSAKSPPVSFEEFARFIIVCINSNKSLSNYLSERLAIPSSDSWAPNLRNTNRLKLLYDQRLPHVLRVLYDAFLLKTGQPRSIGNTVPICCRQSAVMSRELAVTGYRRNCDMQKLSQNYFSLLIDFNYLESVNAKLMGKIQELQARLTLGDVDSDATICRTCPRLQEELKKLKEELEDLTKRFNNAQAEKERMVMKYATSEKSLIEAQRLIKQTEKKHQEALRDGSGLQRKLQKAQADIAKLNGEINSKCSEITQLRNHIEHHKDTDNAKEMKLKWAQNRIKIITDAHEETHNKLTESQAKMADLITECDALRNQLNDARRGHKLEETRTSPRQQASQEVRGNPEGDAGDSSIQKEVESLLSKQRCTEKEKSELVAQICILQKECAEHKAGLAKANTALEREREEAKSLRKQLSQIAVLSAELQSKERRLGSLESELRELQTEKTECQTDIDAYRQREVQILDFTQRLTDKNVQLQCDFTDLQAKLLNLEKLQSPLRSSVDRLMAENKALKRELAQDRSLRSQETELLSKFIAEQAFYNKKLLLRLEESEGETGILRKRYELAIREMTRELQTYRTKFRDGEYQTAKDGGDLALLNKEMLTVLSVTKNLTRKDSVDNEMLDKEKLLNQIIKLQRINVKRAEKLDFLEEHSHALLEELQKTKMTQHYNEKK